MVCPKMGLAHMPANNETARMTLVSPKSRRQALPAALCLARSALSWEGLALGGLLADIPLHQPHCDLQVSTPSVLFLLNADVAVKSRIWVSEPSGF